MSFDPTIQPFLTFANSADLPSAQLLVGDTNIQVAINQSGTPNQHTIVRPLAGSKLAQLLGVSSSGALSYSASSGQFFVNTFVSPNSTITISGTGVPGNLGFSVIPRSSVQNVNLTINSSDTPIEFGDINFIAGSGISLAISNDDAKANITISTSGAGTGTVQSVAVSSPMFTIGGSPITTTGTITINALTGGIPLAAISATGAATGNVITYNGTNVVWAAGGGGGAVTSVTNVDGSLDISPTTGAVVATLASTLPGTYTFTNPPLMPDAGVQFGNGNFGASILSANTNTGDNAVLQINYADERPGFIYDTTQYPLANNAGTAGQVLTVVTPASGMTQPVYQWQTPGGGGGVPFFLANAGQSNAAFSLGNTQNPGRNSIFISPDGLPDITTGTRNIILASISLEQNYTLTSGTDNILIGVDVFLNISTETQNVMVGNNINVISGSGGCTAFGHDITIGQGDISVANAGAFGRRAAVYTSNSLVFGDPTQPMTLAVGTPSPNTSYAIHLSGTNATISGAGYIPSIYMDNTALNLTTIASANTTGMFLSLNGTGFQYGNEFAASTGRPVISHPYSTGTNVGGLWGIVTYPLPSIANPVTLDIGQTLMSLANGPFQLSGGTTLSKPLIGSEEKTLLGAVINTSYIAYEDLENPTATSFFMLPASPIVGETYEIVGRNPYGWVLFGNDSIAPEDPQQIIYFGNQASSPSPSGFIAVNQTDIPLSPGVTTPFCSVVKLVYTGLSLDPTPLQLWIVSSAIGELELG